MEAAITTSPYLTYAEAAVYCRLDRTTLWRAVRVGDLQSSGRGRAVRFHRDELDRFMQNRGSN